MTHESVLTAHEAAHVHRVTRYLEQEIAEAGGWITFERFMELALYAPGLGYYSAGAHKLGARGDFTTAPEISPLFGFCVARQCAEVLDAVSEGSILEIGAGSGRLAVDILTRLESLRRLPLRYLILEVSADLRDRQRRLLASHVPHLLERVVWLDAPPKSPFDGVILSNEVLDALPVARFRWHATHCEEWGVARVHGRWDAAARPASSAIAAHCATLASAAGDSWANGYVSEYCPRLAPWTTYVTRSLRRGAVLWLDYGLPRTQLYLAERNEGTLLCHFRQRAHDDPFLNPGLQDITAWVDFTALAEASLSAGFELGGFTTQTYFLAGLGIDQEMRLLARADEGSFARLANQARQLMMPGDMGERFKAMVWTRGIDLQMSGFLLRDFRHTL